jgi:maltose alpha-D-glucosyltransferase/alpha-amylase
MPGTPVIYYGDEIGMGDNIFLGDRDGVRTPMQWSPDRNGGFSRADPARLYLPPIMDPIYGYGAVNVEAQLRSPTSLLNWTRRMLAVRQTQKAFGRGTLQFLYPGNRKILAFLRTYQDQTVLCVFNLGRSAQAVELDLSRYKTRTPIELMGRSTFPPIGELPYLLTLAAYGFHWFILADQAQLPSWHEPIPERPPEFVTLVVREGWGDLLKPPARRLLESVSLLSFLPLQRWFGAKDDKITGAEIAHAVEIGEGAATFLLAELNVALAAGEPQRYFVPMALSTDIDVLSAGSPLISFTIAQVRRGPRLHALYDAMAARDFPLWLIAAMRAGSQFASDGGTLRCSATPKMGAIELAPDVEVRRLGGEQSNTSILVGDQIVLKIYRKLVAGVHPELEMCRFLTEAGYENTPPLVGAVERLDADGTPCALAVAQGFVRNQGSGWEHALGYLGPRLEEQGLGASLEAPGEPAPPAHQLYIEQVTTLGRRIAELHRALAASAGNPAFDPEPVTARDLKAWRKAAQGEAERTFGALRQALRSLPAEQQEEARQLLDRRKECAALIDAMTEQPVQAVKTRIHGDLHLGQVLVTQNDWHVIDFEGEPAKPMAARRVKSSPLRDVAGMLRSFDYVARAALAHAATLLGGPSDPAVKYALAWRDAAAAAFLAGYRETAAGIASYPQDEDEARRLLDLFVLEKACYELRYEAANRPTWLAIPIRGVRAILDSHARAQP